MYKFESKEELLAYLEDYNLSGLDSEWSPQSRELVEKFNAKEIDVNRWWVLTAHDWKCPCCNRDKSQIVRLNVHRHLIGEIHEHHDHVIDAVRKEFTRASEKLSYVMADESAKKFYKRIAFGFSAYDNTLICFDCNTADAKAKKDLKFEVGSHFSFSPKEISEFIITSPNKPHEIDLKKAYEVWLAAKPMFEKRMELIKHIAHLAATDVHWYQPSQKTAKQEETSGMFSFKHFGLQELSPSGPEGLLYKTNKHQGAADSWRHKVHIPDRTPKLGEIRHMAALNYSNWDKFSDDWHCPICNRKKIECVRKTNKGKWKFSVSPRKIYEDSEYITLFEMCKDCSDTAMNIGIEVKKISGRLENVTVSNLISKEALSRIVDPKPHCKHSIKNELADEVVDELVQQATSGAFD